MLRLAKPAAASRARRRVSPHCVAPRFGRWTGQSLWLPPLLLLCCLTTRRSQLLPGMETHRHFQRQSYCRQGTGRWQSAQCKQEQRNGHCGGLSAWPRRSTVADWRSRRSGPRRSRSWQVTCGLTSKFKRGRKPSPGTPGRPHGGSYSSGHGQSSIRPTKSLYAAPSYPSSKGAT